MNKKKILKNVKRKVRKAGLLFGACILISALAACNTKEAEVKEQIQDTAETNEQENNNEKAIDKKGQEEVKVEAETTKEDGAPETNGMYQVETKEINRNQIKIKYPQLSQEGKDYNAVNQLILNELEQEEIKNIIDGVDIQEDALTLELDYIITYQSENIISILYSGYASIEGSAHPNNMTYGVTIDLSTNKRLYLSDFVDINEEFANQISNSNNWRIDVSKANENIDETTSKAISENVKEFGLNYLIGYLLEESQSDFYLTKDGIGIIAQTAHVMGDYAMTELPGYHEPLSENRQSDYLSLRNENVAFSFKTNKGKTASVCVDKENKYIIYRYGTKDKTELQFPEMNNESWKQFTYTTYYKDKASENNGFQSQKLQFQNGGYQYEIYKEYDVQSGNNLVGIRVKNLSNDEITDIAGDASSFIDNWYSLESTDKIVKQSE